MRSILIQGAGDGGGNNLIRSIRKSGYPVRIVGSNADRFALGQSLADKSYLIPRGNTGSAYRDALKRLIATENIDLLIPNNDTEVAVVSGMRDSLGCRVLLPSHETVEICQDKFALTQFMQRNGFKVPETRHVEDVKQLPEIFAELGGGKLWCRPRRGSGSRGALPVRSPEQAEAWICYWEQMRDIPPSMFLMAEYLPGRDFAFQSLWSKGDLVMAKTVERIDYLFGNQMPSGTSSSPRVGRLTNDPRVNKLCSDVVLKLDREATGMFCIDLKEASDGTPCITEINIGRFFMITIAMNTVGRFNMAELFLRLAFREPINLPEESQFGDIGSEIMLLIRCVDNEPTVLSENALRAGYVDLCG